MAAIVRVDPRTEYFRIHRDLTVSTGEHRPGPPERIDGYTAGLVTMSADAPHGGEVHPDGDEILVVLEGRVQVTGDSAPDEPLELGPGDACIVRAGEWHRVHLLEPTRLLHITPGPNGDHRPPGYHPWINPGHGPTIGYNSPTSHRPGGRSWSWNPSASAATWSSAA